MKSFRTFLFEKSTAVLPLGSSLEQQIAKSLTVPYEITNTTRNRITIKVKSSDREELRTTVEKNLKANKIPFDGSHSGGSIGSTIIHTDDIDVQVLYKPVSGGMSETTLNSTITELAPALAFNARKKFSSVDKFYEFLQTTDASATAYVNAKDAQAGVNFIESFPESSKYQEKMENAIGILKYLYDEEAKSPIDNVWWGYRAKPMNIPSSHKGDLFTLYKTGNVLGVSLKAGGAKTAEPQLNTYVNPIFDKFNQSSRKEKLKSKVYKEIHSQIGLPINWAERSQKKNSIDILVNMQKNNKTRKKYDMLYDKMLDILRKDVVSLFNLNKKATIEYIEQAVIGKVSGVPLVVVKAVGTSYKFVTDEDKIDLILPKVTKIKAGISSSSKQNWYIDLIAGKEKIRMNMSIRSNSAKPNNKLAQGFNLAVKFNGIT